MKKIALTFLGTLSLAAFAGTQAKPKVRAIWSPSSSLLSAGLTPKQNNHESHADELTPGILNPSFEHGLLGWETEGDAFRNQPTFGENVVASRIFELPIGGDYWREVLFPIGVRGESWIGTFEHRPTQNSERGGIQGDLPTGTLTSLPFKITKPYLSFLISGGKDGARLRFELVPELEPSRASPVFPLRVTTGHGSDRFRREIWDVREFIGKTATLRLMDRSSQAGGHINLDDIQELDIHPANFDPAKVVPYGDELQAAWIDADAPVWGFVDLHTHPMSHLGFGGKLLHGSPDGEISKALGDCNCTHGGWGIDNRCGNTIRMALVSQADSQFVNLGGSFGLDHDHPGYPEFRTWPHFTSVAHQQMWHEWLRRAWQGGLRVMVGLAVNNHLLAEGLDGELPRDDRSTVDLQIQGMKDFVQRHSDFLAIATGPDQLREIVRAGKLALILGVEVDNLGNFNFADAERSESAVRSEIRRLYSKGVRYLFPIHLTDNSFGGSAVAGDLFHVAQRTSEAQPLQADPADWKPGEGFQIENASDDPLLHFHLKAPLDEETLKTIRIALHFAEGFPFPWPGTHPHTVGGKLSREREYQILKRFFLTPTPIPNVPGPHRNQKGLSDLGHAAMSEMMRLGMLIDIDHMSEYSVQSSLEHAREITEGGYPLFSGHNSFRTLAQGEVTENSRSDVQLASLRELGGMMGVGYEYVRESGPGKSAALALKRQGVDRITHSAVPADCGGSSKSFAQNYLYAVEKIGTVGFGSDVNGIIKGPGPRFGKWSELRGNYCPPLQQTRPVRYARAAGVREWSGPNLPLLALQTGKRVWDVNTDGVPHYGLLPDFIQDLRNVGVTPEDLDPLFSGAENLARTWGRAVSASSLIRGE